MSLRPISQTMTPAVGSSTPVVRSNSITGSDVPEVFVELEALNPTGTGALYR